MQQFIIATVAHLISGAFLMWLGWRLGARDCREQCEKLVRTWPDPFPPRWVVALAIRNGRATEPQP